MSSKALTELLVGIQEIRDLQAANPTPRGGLPARPKVVRAINRSSVVLLSSHLERYLHALCEEAVAEVNQSAIAGASLPAILRLQHSQVGVDAMLETQWQNRSAQLSDFVSSDSWLWGNAPKGTLVADRLLQWMKSPSPERIKRLFELWEIQNIFARITREPHTRGRFWLKLGELVEKRNNIAHGDSTTEATYQDIAAYLAVVREFCTRADRVLSRTLAVRLGVPLPW